MNLFSFHLVQSDVQRAHAAGIANVDVYIFPDSSQDPSSSTSQIINNLLSQGLLTSNMIWFDIEGTQYWSSSCSSNQQWLATAISTAENMYRGCGLSTCVGM